MSFSTLRKRHSGKYKGSELSPDELKELDKEYEKEKKNQKKRLNNV